jgi:hypothetical protein
MRTPTHPRPAAVRKRPSLEPRRVDGETRARADGKGQAVFQMPHTQANCFRRTDAAVVPARTLFSQLCEAYPTSQFAQEFALKSSGNGIRAAITLTANGLKDIYKD